MPLDRKIWNNNVLQKRRRRGTKITENLFIICFRSSCGRLPWYLQKSKSRKIFLVSQFSENDSINFIVCDNDARFYFPSIRSCHCTLHRRRESTTKRKMEKQIKITFQRCTLASAPSTTASTYNIKILKTFRFACLHLPHASKTPLERH